jgi:hypothetical protein
LVVHRALTRLQARPDTVLHRTARLGALARASRGDRREVVGRIAWAIAHRHADLEHGTLPRRYHVAMRLLCCVAILVATAVCIASADDRCTIVVLGIAAKDTESSKAAGAITAGLRAQAGAKASEYRLTGTAKEVDTAILAAECSAIEARCAAKLGAALSADYAIAGELERHGTHQILVLALVDVGTRQRLRSFRQSTDAGADAKQLARTAYARLIDHDDLGELAIVANAQQGEVSIDGQVVAALFEGRTTLTGLVKGNHMLAIHARGFRPFEIEITIESQTRQMLLLDPLE